jgi:[ribosomal protein S5]-alanine N-acetyltransferase
MNISIDSLFFSSQRIILEPVSTQGLDDFHEYSMYPEFYKYLEFPPFITIDDSKKYLNKMIERSKSPLGQYWFIKSKEHDKIIGSFAVINLNSRRLSVDIGFGLSPSYWGNGYFTESISIIVDYLFNDIHLHRIVALTAKFNKASIIGLEKAGFKNEGLMTDYYKTYDGKWLDAVLMAKVN